MINETINQLREQVAQLEREKSELVAQVEAVKSAYINLCESVGDIDGTEHGSVKQAHAIGDVFEQMRKCWKIVNLTPTQCLNQIKAEAVMDFVEYVVDNDMSNQLYAAAYSYEEKQASIAKGE